MPDVAVLILAAGQSTRMKSKKSKVLHPLAGRPVVSYPIDAAHACGAKKVFVVRGPNQADLAAYVKEAKTGEVVQKRQLGTANAVLAAERALKSFNGHVLVLCGDVPLVRGEVLQGFVKDVASAEAVMGVMTTTLKDPSSYGRIVRDLDGRIVRIVEERDASEDEKKICEVNTGIICADCKWLFKTLKKVGSENAKGEFYLTDLVAIATKEGMRALGVNSTPPEDFLGINTRVDLAVVAGHMRERINKKLMLDGVGIVDHGQTSIDAGVKIGADTTVMPYTFLLGKTKIGRDCVIENGVVLKDAVVGDNVHIKAYSVVEESEIAADAVIGPFARLRPLSKVGRRARIGNFVELKKTIFKEGSKANHLTYLGDAVIGKNVNVGCGTITCNYDGKVKSQTTVGDGAFIGSDTQFVAPVRIGRGSYIGAGSTITKDVPADALALSRSPQVVVKGWAKRKRVK